MWTEQEKQRYELHLKDNWTPDGEKIKRVPGAYTVQIRRFDDTAPAPLEVSNMSITHRAADWHDPEFGR